MTKAKKASRYPALEEFFGTKDVKVTEVAKSTQAVTAAQPLVARRMLVVVKKGDRTVRGIVPADCLSDEILMKEKLAPLKELLERVKE